MELRKVHCLDAKLHKKQGGTFMLSWFNASVSCGEHRTAKTSVGGIAYIVGCVFVKDIVEQGFALHIPTPTKSYPVGSMGIFHCGFRMVF